MRFQRRQQSSRYFIQYYIKQLWSLLRIIIVSLPIVCIFLLTSSIHSIRSPSSSSSTAVAKTTTMMMKQEENELINKFPNNIIYEQVIENDGNIIRFIAKEEMNNNNDDDDNTKKQKQLFYQPISIERWAYLLSTNDGPKQQQQQLIGNQYLYNFTQLLKDIATTKFNGYYFETKCITRRNSNDISFEFVLINANELYKFASIADSTSFQEQLTSCTTTTTKEPPVVGCVFTNLGGDATLIAPIEKQQQQHSNTNTNTNNNKQNENENEKNQKDQNEKSSRTMNTTTTTTTTSTTTTTTTTTTTNNNNKQIYGHLANFVRNGSELEVLSFLQFVIYTYYQRIKTSNNNKDDNNDNNKLVWFSTAGTGVPWLHFRLDEYPKYYSYTKFKNNKNSQ